MTQLPTPSPGRDAVVGWVADHLGDLVAGEVTASPIRGGQSAADRALEGFDVRGYARDRNEVWPPDRRGASGLSPYIRHGLLTLRRVWDAVGGGPGTDVAKFRDELLWQEYARHLYARVGASSRRSLRYAVTERTPVTWADPGGARCLTGAWDELRATGWLPNQSRMWVASDWTVRHGLGWRDGEDEFFRHLLDGSRAANRLGWQWTTGALTGRPYVFTRSQVRRRAPGLCEACPVSGACPVADAPPVVPPFPGEAPPALRQDLDRETTCGPVTPRTTGSPDVVWLTAESLGDDDPAARAYPDLPLVFIFDEALLRGLRLAPMRLVFLAEALADLSTRRRVLVHRGDPVAELADRRLAATFTPVPGWRRYARQLEPVVVHPWPWLVPPTSAGVQSFSAWRRTTRG